MFTRKRVLVCPLDWGLGHATRCVPIIRELLKRDIKVLIAADGRPLSFLQKEFPTLEYIVFAGYSVSYSNTLRMELNMLSQSPQILFKIKEERIELDQIIEKYKVDAVISDNRFGCYSSKVPSIFITHQLMIKCPAALKFLEPLLHLMNLHFINHFNECWIPDSESEPTLSGDLSHHYPLPSNTYFIGPLSRFIKKPSDVRKEGDYILVIFSGPEPQRTLLEDKILHQAIKINEKFIVVRGITEKIETFNLGDNVTVHNHVETEALQELMKNSKLIITRSGYSSIMDLAILEKKAVLIPTPQQTEQIYLAKKFLSQNIFYGVSQKNFNLADALAKANNYVGLNTLSQTGLLEKRIDKLIAMMNKNVAVTPR